MKDRDTFEILLDYPKKHNLDYDTNNNHQRFCLLPSDQFLKTKFVIFKRNNLFFLAYDSFASKAYTSKTFTGVYGLIDLPTETELRIFKKDWSDFFLRMNKRKTRNPFLDRNITIVSKSNKLPKGLFSINMVSQFIDLSKKITPIELIIEHDYISLIKELKGKMIVGIETNDWIYKESDIDVFLNYGDKILDSIIKNASTQQCIHGL